jgi:VWFA-related protein
MRRAAFLILLAHMACAQFSSTVPLVIAPTTVTDKAGHFIDGLTPEDLILYDNNVPVPIQMDGMLYPIDLVVAVQTSENSGAVIDKLGGSGILFAQMLAADAGQTAMISFSGGIRLHQDFTADPDKVTHSLRMLRKEGGSAPMLDAIHDALAMLAKRPAGRRRIVLMIAEKKDRGSNARLAETMAEVQRRNATIYWLTWSPFLQPFTVEPKTVENTKPEAERIKRPACPWCPEPDDRGVPADVGPGGLLYGIGELARLRLPDLSVLFTEATGGRSLGFLKKNGLEQAIEFIGAEVHRQYILSFTPKTGSAGAYHAIRAEVKNRPELQVRTRQGYWALP